MVSTQIFNLVRDVFTMAEICHWTHSHLIARLNESVWQPMAAKRPNCRNVYTRAQRGFASGVEESLLAQCWKKVEFCYRDADGTIYSTHKESVHRLTEEFHARGEGCLLGAMECAHLWKNTDKEFTTWEKPAHLRVNK